MAGMSEQSARVTLRPVVRDGDGDSDTVFAALTGDDDALDSLSGRYQRSIKRVRANYDGDMRALIESIESIDEGFGGLQTDRRGSAGQSTLGDSPERPDAERADERERRRRADMELSEARKRREDEQMDLYTAGATKRLTEWDEDDTDDEDGRGGSGN